MTDYLFSCINAIQDCETPVYEQRLAALKALGDPVVERYNEAGKRTVSWKGVDD